MTWTPIAKPTNQGWSDISKPIESSVITLTQDAEPLGVLIAITVPSMAPSVITGWSDISKPTSSVWSLVAKPTT